SVGRWSQRLPRPVRFRSGSGDPLPIEEFPTMPAIRRILFPTDFSERAETAWSYARLMAERFGTEVILLHVMQEPVAMLPESSLAVAPPAINIAELTSAAEEGLKRLEVKEPARIVDRIVCNGPA